MRPQARRAVASVATLVFLVAYIVLVVTVAGYLPNVGWIRLAYYGVAGIAWGLPLLPLFSWAERDGQDRR